MGIVLKQECRSEDIGQVAPQVTSWLVDRSIKS